MRVLVAGDRDHTETQGRRASRMRGISAVKARLGTAFKARLRPVIAYAAPTLMQFGSYLPHDYNARFYSRPVWEPVAKAADGFPVPPREVWTYMGPSEESFLTSGREDCEAMAKAVAASGVTLEDAGRILDLACAGGRMIRHIPSLAPGAQIWGTDINASAILWCQDNLNPPCQFAVTTMSPRLPFEDRSFGLVYCGSLFTHFDDLAEAWFAELHRILRPGGRLYFTINDRNAVRVFEGLADPGSYPRYWERTGGKAEWDHFVALLRACPGYRRFRAGDAYMFTMGRSLSSHVMWDADVLCDRLAWGYRRCSVIPEAYGHQTAVLLERI